VDVTLAVCELSQKLCSNVNISASAVPKGFLARVKIPIISVEPSLREMFFSGAKFLVHTSNKLKQVKTFVQCSLLEKLPWNADVVGMSHKHWPHANFTRFQKNNLGHFWPKIPTVEVFVFHGHFWPVSFVGHFGYEYQLWKLCLWLRFWATSRLLLCQTRVRVRWRQSLAPHCASRSSCSGRQLLAWDCKYEYTRTPVGMRWHESTSISYPGMERVNVQG